MATSVPDFIKTAFKHFLIGFPTNWEECAEKCLRQGVGSKATVDEAQEATMELQDDQNIDSVEERRFRDTQSNAQNRNKGRQETVGRHDGDACLNNNLHDSNAGFWEQGVSYSLTNRMVSYFEEKKVKHVAQSKSFSKKTVIGDDASTTPSVASLENPQTPGGITPLCGKISKEQADHCTFAASGGANDANHAENIAANRSVSTSGEALAVDKSVHRIKEVQNYTDTCAKSGAAAAEANNTKNHNVRDRDESVQTLDHLRSASVNSKKRNFCEDSTLVGTNGDFSPQDAHKLENSASKKGKRQRGNLTRTNPDNKNCHDSAGPTFRACTSKAKSMSKSDAAKIEPKASQRSTPKFQARRKLYYDEKTTCIEEGENETPTPRISVIRTSRSGRLLLPAMEFWRNQLPIYDKDHAISGIKEGSAILKLRRGVKSSTKKARG